MRKLSKQEIDNILSCIERKTTRGKIVNIVIGLIESSTADENDYCICRSTDTKYLSRTPQRKNDDPRNIYKYGEFICPRYRGRKPFDYMFLFWGRK